MSAGSVSTFAAESNESSGAAFCADTAAAAHSRAIGSAHAIGFSQVVFISVIFMTRSSSGSLAGGRPRGRRLQDVLLHAPRLDFSEHDLVRVAAVHHVHDLKAGRVLAGPAKLAEHRPVQLGLVDLAG